jgi:hypothetical protein
MPEWFRQKVFRLMQLLVNVEPLDRTGADAGTMSGL